MKNLNFANTLIGIGTLGAVFVSYMTLIEIKRERELSMLPDIFIANVENYIDIKLEKGFVNCPYTKEFTILDLESESFSLPIRNLGFGAAKYLEIDWDINFNSINKQFNKRFGDKNKMGLIEFKYDGFTESLITCGIDTIGTLFESSQSLNYLAPNLSKNLNNELKIPDEVIMFSIYSNLMYSECNLPKETLPFYLNIKYTNLIGKKYSKDYVFEMSGYLKDSIFQGSINLIEK